MTQKGDSLLFLGNTPYFLGRAARLLLPKDSEHKDFRNIFTFAFSGAPDRRRSIHGVDPKDTLLPERLDFINDYLKKQGLFPQNPALLNGKTIHIIDTIEAGSGPYFIIRLLGREFQNAGQEVPLFNLINMMDHSEKGEMSKEVMKEGIKKLASMSTKEDFKENILKRLENEDENLKELLELAQNEVQEIFTISNRNQDFYSDDWRRMFFPTRKNPHFSVGIQVLNVSQDLYAKLDDDSPIGSQLKRYFPKFNPQF